MSGKNPNTFWWEEISPEEAQELMKDPEGQAWLDNYVKEKQKEWNGIQARLRPGEPHPMVYEDGKADPDYLTDRQMWGTTLAVEAAQENFALRHAPAPPIKPVDVDIVALGYPQDRENAKSNLRDRTEYFRLKERANMYRDLGGKFNEEKARDLDQLAAMTKRAELKNRKDRPYQVKKMIDDLVVSEAENGLRQAKSWPPEKVRENLEELNRYIECLNHEADGRTAFAVQGYSMNDDRLPSELRVVEVELPVGLTTRQVVQSAEDRGMTAYNYLISIGYREAPPAYEQPEPEKPAIDQLENATTQEAKEAGTDRYKNMSQKQFEEQRVAEGAAKF